jgi:hypothetical protein
LALIPGIIPVDPAVKSFLKLEESAELPGTPAYGDFVVLHPAHLVSE